MKLIILIFLCINYCLAVKFTFPDFKTCYKDMQKSILNLGSLNAIAVDKHLAVAYSTTKPKFKYIKYDPFLNLYLFRVSKELTPVKLRNSKKLELGEWIASMSSDSVYIGTYSHSGNLFDHISTNHKNIKQNSIIACYCCQMYGVSIGKNEFIPSEYIAKFLQEKNIEYATIGATFYQKNKKFYVKNIYLNNSHLKEDDEILSINGKNIRNLKDLNQQVLFANVGTFMLIKIKRNRQILTIRQVVYKRDNLDDSRNYLTYKGIVFDKNLAIHKVIKGSLGYSLGLKKGDKLIQINRKYVLSISDLKKLLLSKKSKGVAYFLFDRNDFDFFVKIKID